MPRLATTVLAGGLSMLMCLTTIAPAQALVVPDPSVPRTSDVEQVRYIRHHGGHGHYHGHDHGHHNDYHDHHYYGHYHHHHHHNNDWVPFAALAAGALIAGAASHPSYHHYGSSHVRWCASRYRSYRASDDTFQPNYGSRQRCISP